VKQIKVVWIALMVILKKGMNCQSIERIEELLALEKNPQQMTKDDVTLYFGNLAEIIRLNLT
jgi:hypothetical protein